MVDAALLLWARADLMYGHDVDWQPLAPSSSHFIPGRNWMWYAVFLASLAFYLYAKATKEVAEAMNRHTFLLR
jgi:hypothetical protein